MGVPRFFSWVNNNYSVIIDPIIKPHEFYFDLNCLLHPKCFEIAGEVLKENPTYDLDKNKDKLEAKIFAKIINYNEEIYTDDIFLFDFDYKFKISSFDKIILFYLFYFNIGNFWTIKLNCKKYMYKFIDFVINNYINQNPPENINLNDTICIHFRCADTPFNRMA